MNRRLSHLMDESEQTIEELLAKLESLNGHPSHDVRHLAECHQQTRRKLVELNLDPDDTTAKELYQALLTRFEADAEQFDNYYQAADKDFNERYSLAVKLVNETLRLPELWALKKTAAKELIRQHPPKHVMKVMGYRSVESLLRRQDIRSVYLAADVLESDSWHKTTNRAISKLDQSAFELRQLAAVTLEAEWLDTARPAELLIASDSQAAVAMLPGSLTQDLPLLSIIMLLAECLQAYGATFKEVYGINEMVGWWAETDGLITSLEGQVVSLNLHDVSTCWLYGHGFQDRRLESGRQSYWHNLVSRYQNHEKLEEIFDSTVMRRVRQLKLQAPEPAYEFDFAEDFIDG
jgi:hypothetical protein